MTIFSKAQALSLSPQSPQGCLMNKIFVSIPRELYKIYINEVILKKYDAIYRWHSIFCKTEIFVDQIKFEWG